MSADAERAHAKINLFLHVVGRRADGYHLLDSLAVFAGAHDRLQVSVTPKAGLFLVLDGRFGDALRDQDVSGNLVLRAARALLGDEPPGVSQDATPGSAPRLSPRSSLGLGPGLSLLLGKELPVASGIGGGSADAAAALRLILRLRPDRHPGEERLQAIAYGLGADVPVCLRQQPARMRGIGERLDPAPVLPSCFMLLVNCGVGVSTPSVFRARAPGFSAEALLPDAWPDARAMAADLLLLDNDLQAAAIGLCPEIDTVLEAIGRTCGCLLARMSGSGATCFGLFETAALAETAARSVARPGWWVWAGPMLSASATG